MGNLSIPLKFPPFPNLVPSLWYNLDIATQTFLDTCDKSLIEQRRFARRRVRLTDKKHRSAHRQEEQHPTRTFTARLLAQY